MAIIPQLPLLSWDKIEARSDLDRLDFVLRIIPDERLMRLLERERANGRDDYPIRALWNCVLAGIVFQHKSVESLRRELSRNAELRARCGFDAAKGARAVPPAWVCTRFLRKLIEHADLLHAIGVDLLDKLADLLPDLGEKLAIDSKALPSFGKPTEQPAGDGRRETDADWGKKTYKGARKDGSAWSKVVEWFGFKLHLLCDTTHELPLSWEVTRASVNDVTRALPLVERLQTEQPKVLARCREVVADKGYDAGEVLTGLWDKRQISPVIDIRNCWQDEKGGTRPLYPQRADNIVYDYKGTVSCHCPATDEVREMAFQGFEKDRQALKYRCPAAAYGLECKGRSQCGTKPPSDHGRIVRILLSQDRRIFTPLARSSYAWKKAYARRTAVERINSRLDVSLGFEEHTIRGLRKMKARVDLTMAVMLAMALSSVLAGEQERMRSLVRPVARAA